MAGMGRLGVGVCLVVLGAGCAAPKPVATKTSPVDDCRMVNVGSGLRYDCEGFTAAFHDDPPNAPENPQGNLDRIVAGLVEGLQPLRDKLNAKIRVERSVQKIGGKSVLAATVVVDDPTAVEKSFAAGTAVAAGRRGILCSATTGAGMERCGPVIRYLLEDR